MSTENVSTPTAHAEAPDKGVGCDALLGSGVRVRTFLGEVGTITSSHMLHADWFWVRIEGGTDKQNPPRWIGEISECYRAHELSVLPNNKV
jgi:hypothetical protein